MNDRPRPILVVEDNDDDYEACLTAFRKDERLAPPLRRSHDGQDALDYLLGRDPYGNTPARTPCLILLDLNLPGMDGRHILAEIKSHDDLRKVPVIVMTSSRDPRDIEACYDAGANSYVVKPTTLTGFVASISRLRDYWFEVSLLPGGA